MVEPGLAEGLDRDPRRRLLDGHAHVLHRREHGRQHSVCRERERAIGPSVRCQSPAFSYPREIFEIIPKGNFVFIKFHFISHIVVKQEGNGPIDFGRQGL